MQTARLKKELKDMQRNAPAGCTATNSGPFINQWDATIQGPEGSLYEGGVFKLLIIFPAEYPFKPPQVTFKTRIFHPNISPNGSVCLNILKPDMWEPRLTVANLLTSIRVLLSQPNGESPSNTDAGMAMMMDKQRFEQMARDWTRRFAQPQ